MDQKQMLSIVRNQLSLDLNCSVADLNGNESDIVFVRYAENPGRRPFPRREGCFNMLTMGNRTVISASDELLPLLKNELADKTRDEAFSSVFVYGFSMYFLPDLDAIKKMPVVEGYTYEMIEKQDMTRAYEAEGFHHAVSYDVSHPRPDVLAVVAIRDGAVVGMAGASEDCEKMWQVGIDVLPEHRGRGLAAYLVNRLTLEILARDRVPYYGTSGSNVASQRTAYRAGYMLSWVNAYRGRFGELLSSPNG